MSAGARDPGLVVLLDGPQGVGVTTTLRALQREWPRVRPGPLLDLGLEHTLGAFGHELHRWSSLIGGTLGPPGAPRWGPLGRELVVAAAHAVATWARLGWDVAVDEVALDRVAHAEVGAAFDGLRVVHVGLTCDPDVLEDRAREVSDEAAVRALAQLESSDASEGQDLVIDTTAMTTDEIVDVILDLVARRLRG